MWLFKSKIIETSDQDLLLSYKESGNLIYIEDLYNKYLHLVYGTCLKYLDKREASQDAVMDIFEKLVIKLKEHEVKNFKSWLYTLTRNHCLMIIRKQSGIKQESLDLFSQNLPEHNVETLIEYHPYDIDEAYADQEQQLNECLEALKDTQKKCVQLFYFSEMSYQQISKKLLITKEKVKSQIQNGKRNLKTCMDRKNGKRKTT